MKKAVYIRCPRCELNYIQKKDKYCSVCKAEMEAKKDNDDDLDMELCPICKTNYIQPDEIMCASCLKEHRGEDGDDTADWEDYLVSEEDDDDISMYDELGEMATVNDLTKAGMLDDDDDITGDIDFDDSDEIDFSDEEFSDEEEEEEEEEDEYSDDDDFDDDFDDEDFDDDDDDDDDDDEDFDDDDE